MKINFKAVLWGIFLCWVFGLIGLIVLSIALGLLAGLLEVLGGPKIEVSARSVPFLLFVTGCIMFSHVFGGWIVARTSNDHAVNNAMMMGILSVIISLFLMPFLYTSFPFWVGTVFWLTFILSAALGGKLYEIRRKKLGKNETIPEHGNFQPPIPKP